jgi:glycosyltransferase involved in cell wall biosynthesis
VSGHGALAEKVRDGVDGLVFPPGDADSLRQALQRLVDEPDLLQRLRRRIPPPVDIVEHAGQLETVYGQLVAARHA